MDDKLKLCKDCKHFNDGEVYWRGIKYPVIGDLCTRLVTRFDPVDGAIMDTKELIKCREYRAEVTHMENKCGPEGKHWELD